MVFGKVASYFAIGFFTINAKMLLVPYASSMQLGRSFDSWKKF